MKKYLLFLFVLGSLISTQAQNITEIPIQSTNKLVINSNLPVHIYKSDSLRIKVSSGKQGMKGINITPGPEGVTIDATRPDFDNNNIGSSIDIYTNNLENITASGGTYIFVEDNFAGSQMNISVNDNSDFTGKITCDHLNLTASGASDVVLIGGAGSMNAVASGSSDLKLFEFPVQKMNVTVSGASDAYVDVTDELTAVASGASDIYYKNEPVKLNANTSGASDIKKYNGESTDKERTDKKNKYNPQNSKRFVASRRDMFGGGKMHQDLVWMGIDIGIDGLVDLTNGFDLQPQGDYNFMEMNYGRNAHVRVNFFEWRFNLVKNVFNIVTGMGMDFQHFAFAQKVRFDEANDYPNQTFLTPVIGAQDSVHSINRSRLAVQYFNVPLFFNLRTKKTEKHKNQFNFTFGVVGGIKTGSSSRIQYTENGYDAEEEKKDDFNLSTFTATAMVRIKYSFFSIYASYQFTPMFRGQNPNLYPFTLGVTLLSW